MSRSSRRPPVRNAGAFMGPDILIAAPTRTLSDEYHDEPAEPVDSDLVPEPGPPGLIRRVIDGLKRQTHRRAD